MDTLAHFAAAREAFRAAYRLASEDDNQSGAGEALRVGFGHLDAAEELYRHQLKQWTSTVRDAAKPCPPSELPDSRLGEPLRKVRDFLRPSYGRPPDPLFDEVVGKLGGPANVRRMLDGATGSGLELWTYLSEQAEILGARAAGREDRMNDRSHSGPGAERDDARPIGGRVSALAAPPPLPLAAVDLPVPGGRLRRHPTGLVEILYDGLPPLLSWPEDTPFHRELADAVAGGDLFETNLQHELAHAALVPEWLGLPHSPTLHVAAQKAAGVRHDWWPWWWQEEQVVLGVQRLAATLGIDLVELSAEASRPANGVRR